MFCSFSMSDHLCINESLDDQGLKLLVNAGLQKRFPKECSNWSHESTAVENQCRKRQDDELKKVKKKLDTEEKGLSAAVHDAVVDEALKLYPYVLDYLLTSLSSIFSTVSSRRSRSRIVGAFPQMCHVSANIS